MELSKTVALTAILFIVVLILTSNAGSREMSVKSIGFAGEGTTDERDEAHRRTAAGKSKAAIERVFSPEFRNRLDAMISFKALDTETIMRVVEKFLMQLDEQLAEKKVEAAFTDALKAHLAKKGFDPLMGARPMARLIQDTIRRALADELLFGKLQHGGKVTIDIGEDEKIKLKFEEEPAAVA